MVFRFSDTTPRSGCWVNPNPAWASTSSMGWFSTSTSASTRRIAAVPCQCEQVLEEQGAETLAVMGVGDQESDLDGVDGLGVGGPGADELCGREPLEVTIDLGDQR